MLKDALFVVGLGISIIILIICVAFDLFKKHPEEEEHDKEPQEESH